MVFSQFSLLFPVTLFPEHDLNCLALPSADSLTDTFVCFPTAFNDSGIFTVSLLQCSQWHIQAILAAPWKQPRDSNLHLPQVMGILTHLHTHRSCWTLGWALRDSSAASHWCFSVCLPPSPWVLCKLWHFDIEILIIEEKIRNYCMPFPQKKKEIKRMPDVRSSEIGTQITEFSVGISYVPRASALLPPTASSQQVQGLCCGQGWPAWGQVPPPGRNPGKVFSLWYSFKLNLWSESNVGNACAAFKQSHLYHLWLQTSSTFAIEIQIYN